MQHVFGPIPSRRLGRSLGISPIPDNVCNFSCIYCQLGRTEHMQNKREEFFPLAEIFTEVDEALASGVEFDVLTIVGEGEPTLSTNLKPLIEGLHQRSDKPVAVITNGALLTDPEVKEALLEADIVLPSFDAVDPVMFKRLNRPYANIDFQDVYNALLEFSQAYQGALWLEIMLLQGVNDSRRDLARFAELLSPIKYDKLYLNTAVRPPAEADVKPASPETMTIAASMLNGIVIDQLTEASFDSVVDDPYEAICDICRRHPMNQHEISAFLDAHKVEDPSCIFTRLAANPDIEIIPYKGYDTYQIKKHHTNTKKEEVK